METPMSSKQSREQASKRLDPDVLEVVQEQPQKTPPRNWVDRSERRNNWDRRTAPGNGTASSAVAPSERPVFAAHRSNISGVVLPPGPNRWPLNIPAVCSVPPALRLSVSPIHIA